MAVLINGTFCVQKNIVFVIFSCKMSIIVTIAGKLKIKLAF